MQKCRQQKRIEIEKQYCIKIDTFCCLSLFLFAYMENLQKMGNEQRSIFLKTVLNTDRQLCLKVSDFWIKGKGYFLDAEKKGILPISSPCPCVGIPISFTII